MIQIIDHTKYEYYKGQRSAFLMFFFKQENGEVKNHNNLAIIKKIQSLEVRYKDLPLLAFNYDNFIKYNPNEINSFLDIIITRNYHERILYENPDVEKIPIIFDLLRKMRLELTVKRNKEFQENGTRFSMRAWIVKGEKTLNHLIKCDKERMKIQNRLMGITENSIKKSLQTVYDPDISSSRFIKNIKDKEKWRKRPVAMRVRKNNNKKLNESEKSKKEIKIENITQGGSKPHEKNQFNLRQQKIPNTSRKLQNNFNIIKYQKEKLKINELYIFQNYQNSDYISKISHDKLKIKRFLPYTIPISNKSYNINIVNNFIEQKNDVRKSSYKDKDSSKNILSKKIKNNQKMILGKCLNNISSIYSNPTPKIQKCINDSISLIFEKEHNRKKSPNLSLLDQYLHNSENQSSKYSFINEEDSNSVYCDFSSHSS